MLVMKICCAEFERNIPQHWLFDFQIACKYLNSPVKYYFS